MSERSSGRIGISTLAALRRVPGFVAKTVERKAVTRRLARHFRERPDHPAVDREEAIAAIEGADRILFLCWGNICRSPLAERYLRSRLEALGIDCISVESAGLGKVEGRASPATALQAATNCDVDLSDHRSTLASAETVEDSDVVFVMDYYNYYLLVTQYPKAVGRTFFLGALVEKNDSTSIPDPHGEDREAFDDAYATIVDAVDRLAEGLSASAGSE